MGKSLGDLAWPVTTERLLLRPHVETDLAELWAYRQLPEVDRWLGSPAAVSAEAFGSRFFSAEIVPFHLVVVLRATGVVIGDLMLRVRDGWAQGDVREVAAQSEGELGWVLSPSYGGKGLATEAVSALVDVCFAPPPDGLGLRRLTAACFAANEPSWRLMERLGMRREQHGRRDSYHRDLGWSDGVTYALLTDER